MDLSIREQANGWYSNITVRNANAASGKVMKSIPWQTWVGLDHPVLYLEGEVGRTRQLAVHLPQSMMLVSNLEDSTSSAAGGVTVEYSSADEKIATVSADGVITPKSLGKTSITIKFTYSYGKVKVVTKNIVVRRSR